MRVVRVGLVRPDALQQLIPFRLMLAHGRRQGDRVNADHLILGRLQQHQGDLHHLSVQGISGEIDLTQGADPGR